MKEYAVCNAKNLFAALRQQSKYNSNPENQIMKGLTFKTTGTWFYFDDSREFFKGDYIVATGPVYDTNHSTSNKHERLLDQTYNGILNVNPFIILKVKDWLRLNLSVLLS